MDINTDYRPVAAVFSSAEVIAITLAVILALAAIALGILALKTRGVSDLNPLHCFKALNNRTVSLLIGGGGLTLVGTGIGIYVKVRLSDEPKKKTYHLLKPRVKEETDTSLQEEKITYSSSNDTKEKQADEWLQQNKALIESTFTELMKQKRLFISKQNQQGFYLNQVKKFEHENKVMSVRFILNFDQNQRVVEQKLAVISVENKEQEIDENEIVEFKFDSTEEKEGIVFSYDSANAKDAVNSYMKQYQGVIQNKFQAFKKIVCELRKGKNYLRFCGTKKNSIDSNYLLVVPVEVDENKTEIGDERENTQKFSHRLYFIYKTNGTNCSIDVFYDQTDVDFKETNDLTSKINISDSGIYNIKLEEKRDSLTIDKLKEETEKTRVIRNYIFMQLSNYKHISIDEGSVTSFIDQNIGDEGSVTSFIDQNIGRPSACFIL